MDEIRSVEFGGLRFSDEPDGRSSKGDVWWFRAEIAIVGLEARTRVSLADHPEEKPLAPFFYDLAKDWRGWKGRRVWAAYEGGLTLSCAHDGSGHILMETELRELARDWEVRVALGLEAGQLDSVARRVERFFAPDLAHRLP